MMAGNTIGNFRRGRAGVWEPAPGIARIQKGLIAWPLS